MEKYYLNSSVFNYIRYNSLPAWADYILDHPPEYYKGWGVSVRHHKPVGGLDASTFIPKSKVFVNADLIPQLLGLLEELPPYHLITGNSDVGISQSVIDFILTKTKIITWTGHNFKKIDNRFLQIPMGFCEMGPQRPNAFTEYVTRPEFKIVPLVITPFSVTHNSRTELYDLVGKGILNLTADRLNYQDFLYSLSISKYSCCPRGNALDSHRFVESILMDSVPIVMTSDLDPVYKEMGGIIVEDWEECKEILRQPPPELNRDVVTEEYWKNRMIKHQESYERN